MPLVVVIHCSAMTLGQSDPSLSSISGIAVSATIAAIVAERQ